MDHVGTAGLIESTIKRYLQTLQENRVDVWRLYLFGSHARGTAGTDSDIDLAVFWDREEIDGFDEDVQLMRGHQVNSFLVGEAFMRADDPGAELAKVFGV